MRISDWSSDVCSSDLELPGVVRIRDLFGFPEASQRQGVGRRTAGRKIVLGIGNAIGADVGDDLREAVRVANELSIKIRADQRDVEDILVGQLDAEQFLRLKLEIGRASGRERVCQ